MCFANTMSCSHMCLEVECFAEHFAAGLTLKCLGLPDIMLNGHVIIQGTLAFEDRGADGTLTTVALANATTQLCSSCMVEHAAFVANVTRELGIIWLWSLFNINLRMTNIGMCFGVNR